MAAARIGEQKMDGLLNARLVDGNDTKRTMIYEDTERQMLCIFKSSFLDDLEKRMLTPYTEPPEALDAA